MEAELRLRPSCRSASAALGDAGASPPRGGALKLFSRVILDIGNLARGKYVRIFINVHPRLTSQSVVCARVSLVAPAYEPKCEIAV